MLPQTRCVVKIKHYIITFQNLRIYQILYVPILAIKNKEHGRKTRTYIICGDDKI